jgi:hypothetical protein
MFFCGLLVPVTAFIALITLVIFGQMIIAGTLGLSAIVFPVFLFALLAVEMLALRWATRNSNGDVRYVPTGTLIFFACLSLLFASLTNGTPTQPPADLLFTLLAMILFLMAYLVRPLKD